jgi:hypothetical protein
LDFAAAGGLSHSDYSQFGYVAPTAVDSETTVGNCYAPQKHEWHRQRHAGDGWRLRRLALKRRVLTLVADLKAAINCLVKEISSHRNPSCGLQTQRSPQSAREVGV